jgi:hypothetical protein
MICQDFYKLWKTQAFPFADFVYKIGGRLGLGGKLAILNGEGDMTARFGWFRTFAWQTGRAVANRH